MKAVLLSALGEYKLTIGYIKDDKTLLISTEQGVLFEFTPP